MQFEQITYEISNKTAIVTLNRPEKRNALSAKILRELRLHPKAKLNPDQAVRVFNHMEETLNARQ